MTYQEFLSDIQVQLAPRLAVGTTLQIQPVNKNNGLSYDGLIINSPGSNMAPTIYLNPYYHRYLEGVSLESICSDILDTYQNHMPYKNFDTSAFLDFDKVKSRLTLRLINYEKNRQLLREIPHIPYLNLAIVFYCLLEASETQQAAILIYNHHLRHWHVDKESLFDLSLKNSPHLLPSQLENMKEILALFGEESPEEEPTLSMYVLSNTYRSHGAAAILYPSLLSRIAAELQQDLIILPSSIHEVLLVPAPDFPDYDAFRSMVREVNEMQLPDEEVLSDQVYLFSRESGEITIAPAP